MTNRTIQLFLLAIACVAFSHCSQSTSNEKSTLASNTLIFDNVSQTKEFFAWDEDKAPMVSAHRGGNYPGYPENSIAAFAYILDHTPSLIECDISMTRDSVLVMMHDNTLDRTTTGTGKIADKTFGQLASLRLKDSEGTITEYKIPTLREVLNWAKNNTVLTLDIKSNVPYEMILQEIEETGTAAQVVLITYSLDAAKKLYHLNPDIMLSVTIRNEEEWGRFLDSGIPTKNILAFTGVTERKEAFNKLLHDHGVSTILGVLGNLDQRAQARGASLYQEFVTRGADILATDRPIEAAKAIK